MEMAFFSLAFAEVPVSSLQTLSPILVGASIARPPVQSNGRPMAAPTIILQTMPVLSIIPRSMIPRIYFLPLACYDDKKAVIQ